MTQQVKRVSVEQLTKLGITLTAEQIAAIATMRQVESTDWSQVELDLNADLANEAKESGLESLMKEYDAEQKKLNPKFDKVLDLSNKVRAKVLGQPKYTAIEGLGKRLAIDGPHRENNNVWIVNILRSFSATIARRAKIVHAPGHKNAIGFIVSKVEAVGEKQKAIRAALLALDSPFHQKDMARALAPLGIKRERNKFKFSGKGRESWADLVERYYGETAQVLPPTPGQVESHSNSTSTPKSGKTISQVTQLAAK